MKNLTKIVNHADVSKNVPLHYATNNWDQRIISKLFEYGAMSSVGLSNLEDEQPISKINPNVSKGNLTLEVILNLVQCWNNLKYFTLKYTLLIIVKG